MEVARVERVYNCSSKISEKMIKDIGVLVEKMKKQGGLVQWYLLKMR
jgi:hypothetical protein